MVSKFIRDTCGASLVEFTLVFPFVMLAVFGTVDVSLLMLDWAQAHKATYAGARQAAISTPVTGLNNWNYSSAAIPGDSCYDGAGASTGKCTTVINKRCRATSVASSGLATAGNCCSPSGSSCGSATNWTTDDTKNFNGILAEMRKYHPEGTLDPRQVQIDYQTTGLGFAYQPGGQPMNVTVAIRCKSHEFYFLEALMGWVFPSQAAECAGIPNGKGLRLPPFSSTLPSEDLDTSNNY